MSDDEKKRISPKTKEILSILSRKAKAGLIFIHEASNLLNMPVAKLSNRLGSLAKAGWINRIRRGLYYIPPIESKPGMEPVIEDAWILAQLLYSPCYIGGWSAAEHWGLTDQIFKSTFVISSANIRKRSEVLMGVNFEIAKVAKYRIMGTVNVWRGSEQVAISDKEKTIADGLSNPNWVGGIRHLIDMLKNYANLQEKDFLKITNYLLALKKSAPFKRLGFLMEKFFPNQSDVIKLALDNRKSGNIRLDPSIKKNGNLNKKWGLWVNVDLNSLI